MRVSWPQVLGGATLAAGGVWAGSILHPLAPMGLAAIGAGLAIGYHQVRKAQAQDLLAEMTAEAQAVRSRAESDLKRANAKAQANLASATERTLRTTRMLELVAQAIRTPLASVSGATEIVRSGPLSPRQREATATSAAAIRDMTSVLDQIIDMTQVEAGVAGAGAHATDLRRLVESEAEAHRPAAMARGVSLVADIPADGETALVCDEDRVRRVLAQFLSNAIAASQHGQITAWVKTKRVGQQLNVALGVDDPGAGMSPEELACAFDPFLRPKSGNQAQRRPGIGLAGAKATANAIGGRIEARSIPGKGSRFVLMFDALAADLRRMPEAAPASIGRVLVVDDNDANRFVLVALLEAAELLVDAATNGADALRQMERAQYDIVIMDQHMPGLSGVETIQTIRRTLGPNRHAAIVAVTADVTAPNTQACLAAGADEFAPKPIVAQRLLEAVSRADAKRRDRLAQHPGRAA